MACLHRFVPHPALEMLYCEHCALTRPFAAAVKEPKPKVVKTDDVDASVARYLDAKLAQMPQAEPVQEDLFHTPVMDLGEDIYAKHLDEVEAARQRAEARERQNGEMPDGFFDANLPGGKQWVGP